MRFSKVGMFVIGYCWSVAPVRRHCGHLCHLIGAHRRRHDLGTRRLRRGSALCGEHRCCGGDARKKGGGEERAQLASHVILFGIWVVHERGVQAASTSEYAKRRYSVTSRPTRGCKI